jgi:DegV family protein with EDD domain
MKIKYLNGSRLYHAFLAGGNAVIQDQNYLNKINVFPVPDSDTGTNLASTMRSIASRARASHSIKTTLSSIADAALVGARGNSGLIFAQYIYGISKEVQNEPKLSTKTFAESVKRAVQYAYKSIVTPVEGTMITLIHDWADAVFEHHHKTTDFVELLSYSHLAAERSLKDTPKKLAVLARAGVVDAGAKGFVDFLEGVLNFIKKGSLKDIPKAKTPWVDTEVRVHSARSSVRKRFCTEAMILGKNLDLEKIQEVAQPLGESTIVAGSEEKIRIHTHTDDPAGLFSRLSRFGAIAEIKADDMLRQYEANHARKSPIALVTDSSCDLPQAFIDDHQIHILPFQLSFGDSLYLDKITIHPPEFYSELKSNKNMPKTSQPSLATVQNLLSFLASHYESVIVITISDKLTGIYGQFVKAASELPDKKISVLNSKHISASLGLIVQRAAEAIRQGKAHDEIVRQAEEWISKTRVVVDVHTLKYFVRGGRVSRMKGLMAGVLQLKPIIALDSEGAVENLAKAFGRGDRMKKILRTIGKLTEGKRIWNYAIVHAQNPDRAKVYEEKLSRMLQRKPAFTLDVSPIIGVHSGIGSLAIALMPE